MSSLTTKQTNTLINVTGSIELYCEGKTVSFNLTNDQQATDFFLSCLNNSRKENTETDLIRNVMAGNLTAAMQSTSSDFEYPMSLQELVTKDVTLGRAKGKVTPGSVEVLINHISAGKATVVGLANTLANIPGYHLVTKKAVAVVDTDGMPVAVKYIVSPIVK